MHGQPMLLPKLTPKEHRFCDEYPIDLNGAAAARRAGYSKTRADRTAAELLKKPAVRERILAQIEQRSKEAGVTQRAVLEELARIAFFDPRRLFTSDGQLKPIQELDDATAAGLQSLEVVTSRKGQGEGEEVQDVEIRTSKIRLWSKTDALAWLGKHLALFVDRVEHSVDKDLEARIVEARKRAGLGS
jgi:phage terminase small subunit